jgi:hypothetical protein
MNINNLFPSNYLKAADLQGREVEVIMDRVAMEDIGGDHKAVLYFQHKEKGVVLNKTNSTNIASIYGPETDGWNGRKVTLYSAWVDFQGRSVEAIRIRGPQAGVPPQQATQTQAPLDDDLAADSIPF